MLRNLKVWLFLLVFSILILMLGHLLFDRLGLLVAFALALAINYYTLLHQHRDPTDFLKAQQLIGRDAWGLLEILKHLLIKAKMPEPALYIFNHSAPITFTIATGLESGVIGFSTSLLQRLNSSEVEAILALELAILKNKLRFRNVILEKLGKTWLLIGQSLDDLLGLSKLNLTLFTRLIYPIVWIHFKFAFPKKSFLKAEKLASTWLSHPAVLAHALWKIHNIMLSQEFTLPIGTEHHLLLPSKSYKINSFQLQPTIEERLKKLVGYFPI